MNFHNRLKEYRERSQKTRKELAAEIGVSLSAYTNYEAGNREPDIDKLVKIARALNVSLDNLLGRYKPIKKMSWQGYLHRE